MRNKLITTESEKLEYYKGLLIHAHSGLHESAASLCKKYLPIGKEVIDIGAGAGAFTQRLVDENYKVTALDLSKSGWPLNDIEFIELNIDFGIFKSLNNRVFDCACCLEVVEHLENPWNLFREIFRIVRPGGYLVLSTPNITSFLSRMYFLRSGEFFQFNGNTLEYGHINPISDFEISLIAEKVGWRLIEKQPAGYLPIFRLTNPRHLLTNIFRGLSYILSKGNKNGWCMLYIFQKL